MIWLLLAALIFALRKWYRWRTISFIQTAYTVEHGIPEPSPEDFERLRDFVVKNSIRDLLEGRG